MANIIISHSVTNSDTKTDHQSGSLSVAQNANPKIYKDTFTVGTSESSVTSFGQIPDGEEGVYHIKNRGSGYLRIGPAASTYMERVPAGGESHGHLEPSASIFWAAENADTEVDITVYRAP